MNLLMISGDRTVASGKEGAFLHTLRYLSTQFDRIDVLCPRVRGQAVTHVFDTVYLHPAPCGRLLFPFWLSRAGRKLFSNHQHAILTVHDYPPFLNGLGARLLLRRIRIPSVLELHHLVGMPKAASFSELIGRWMTKLFLRGHAKHFSTVRVVNATVKRELQALGIEEGRIRVVPSVYLNMSVLESIHITEKKYDFVFSARIVPNKGLMTVLSALARVPNATLLVIGDGPELGKAKKHAEKLGVAARVTCTGWLGTAREVLTAMQSGSVFIMHSSSEGNPRVAIEAMALGLPVLSTRVGIMPDVIEDGRNGLFVSGSVDDLVRAMQEMTDADERIQRMGHAAREDIGRFDGAETLKGYADFLRSVAS